MNQTHTLKHKEWVSYWMLTPRQPHGVTSGWRHTKKQVNRSTSNSEADRQVCFKQTVWHFTRTLIYCRFQENIQNSSVTMLATVKHSVTSTATNCLYTFSCTHSPTSACTFPMFALSLNGQQSTSCHWNGPTINKLLLKWVKNPQAVTQWTHNQQPITEKWNGPTINKLSLTNEMGPQSTSCHWMGPQFNNLSLIWAQNQQTVTEMKHNQQAVTEMKHNQQAVTEMKH